MNLGFTKHFKKSFIEKTGIGSLNSHSLNVGLCFFAFLIFITKKLQVVCSLFLSGRAREIRTLDLGVRVRCLNHLAIAQYGSLIKDCSFQGLVLSP